MSDFEQENHNTEWSVFPLHSFLQEMILKNNYLQPTPVQQQTLSFLNQKKDLLIAAQTGSGKTFCYLFPILNHLLSLSKDNHYIQALIMLPTRELAIQVYKNYMKFLTKEIKHLKPGLIIGGFSKEKQMRILEGQPKVIIATPGRLLDLMKEKDSDHLKYLTMIQFLVLDEVDRIIELDQFKELSEILNFINKSLLTKQKFDEDYDTHQEVRNMVEFEGKMVDVVDEGEIKAEAFVLDIDEIKIARQIQKTRQTILVSATLTKISGTSRMLKNKKFKKFLKKKIKNNKEEKIHPKIVDVMKKIEMKNEVEIIDLTKDKDQLLPSNLKFYRIKCQLTDKPYILEYVLRKKDCGLSIIFVNSINAAKKLKSILQTIGYSVTNLHSHMKQVQRIKKMESFSKNKQNILITTDVASRGIDITGINTVIHYHTPPDLDTFIHRSGRTARIGTEGQSIIITDVHDSKRFVKYQKDLGHVEYWDLLPSELFKNKEVVDRALDIERQQFQLDKQTKEKNWLQKMSGDVGLDFEDDLKDIKEEEIQIKKKEYKQVRRQFKELKQEKQLNIKKFSTFISSMDIEAINQQIKNSKK